LVLSTGGGRPLKKNVVICKAVKILNEKYNLPFKFAILGRDSTDTKELKEAPYTQYIGQISKQDAMAWFKKTNIYITNSVVESFGLAPIEALSLGCSLLTSKNVGALSIIDTLQDVDTIQNYDDEYEIAGKIKELASIGNNQRLLNGINKEETSVEASCKGLFNIIQNL